MIELTAISINDNDSIVIARNKLYRLALDLNFGDAFAIRLALQFSEMLHLFLKEDKTTVLRLCFTKTGGYYFLNSGVLCSPDMHEKLMQSKIFLKMYHASLKYEEQYLCYLFKIENKAFSPSDNFLQEERERLIQSSSGEMIREIKIKNDELSKSLQKLRSSSQIVQTEKMRALGAMTAGVAHELNNPMMGILNYVQYAIEYTDKTARYYKPLVDAEREIKRCQDIITNLLTFSRMGGEGEEHFSSEKLSILCERILQLEAYKLRSANVQVIKQFPADEFAIAIKPSKMQQVILNLVVNAIDAMQESKEKILTLTLQQSDHVISFSVKDTGTGIDEETQDKIFEPFFTTKKVGKGTGLGLPVTQSIIEEHGGNLQVKTEVGKGTTFIVTLPVKQKTAEEST
ncbi:MAG: HAMP domain-containing sensor histidine kinase [Gammaproteobacteria bacterium]|nr:HAMP domain-containing sensor histidine kinase [Gammaproteobacteria bacterium]